MSVEDGIGDVIKRTSHVQELEIMMNATSIIRVGTVSRATNLQNCIILHIINSQDLIHGTSRESWILIRTIIQRVQ